MTEHRLLTGGALHEPKGIENVAAGRVYVSDGFGSGAWTDRNEGNLLLNRFLINRTLPDISEAISFYDVMAAKVSLSKIYVTLAGTITGANSTLTIYKNNIAQTPTVIIPYIGSGPGVVTAVNISPAVIFMEGDVLRVGSDGASTGSQPASVSLSFTAIV